MLTEEEIGRLYFYPVCVSVGWDVVEVDTAKASQLIRKLVGSHWRVLKVQVLTVSIDSGRDRDWEWIDQ